MMRTDETQLKLTRDFNFEKIEPLIIYYYNCEAFKYDDKKRRTE